MELVDPKPGPEKDAEWSIDKDKSLSTLESLCDDASEREIKLLSLRLQDLDNEQIAMALGEPVELIQADLNRLFARIRARIKSGAGKTAPTKQKRKGASQS